MPYICRSETSNAVFSHRGQYCQGKCDIGWKYTNGQKYRRNSKCEVTHVRNAIMRIRKKSRYME